MEKPEKLILITGAAGLIGSAVVRDLNARGYTKLLLVDKLGSDSKWQNLQNLSFSLYLEYEEFLHRLKMQDLTKDIGPIGLIGLIIHMGANSNTMETNATELISNNYQFSITLAEFAIRKRIRMVYASSAATYGDGGKGFSDDHSLLSELRPLNAYGFSKHLFDLWLQQCDFKPSFVGLKYFNVFGPNEYHKGQMQSLIPKAYQQIQESGKMRLFKSANPTYPDGKQIRDFLYVEDAARITNFFALNQQTDCQGIFNVGSGHASTWLDLATGIFAAMDRKMQIEFIDMPNQIADKYQYYTLADISKLRAIGYQKKMTPLKTAVADYINNYLQKNFRRA